MFSHYLYKSASVLSTPLKCRWVCKCEPFKLVKGESSPSHWNLALLCAELCGRYLFLSSPSGPQHAITVSPPSSSSSLSLHLLFSFLLCRTCTTIAAIRALSIASF